MATTVNKQSTRIDYSQMKEDNVGNTTARNDVFGKSGKLYFLYIGHDGGGTSVFDYLKLYDTKAEVTVGTDAPDYIFSAESGSKEIYHFPNGLTFNNGLAFNASDTGGTAAGGNPSATLDIQMVFK
jgi:hypothetical protein